VVAKNSVFGNIISPIDVCGQAAEELLEKAPSDKGIAGVGGWTVTNGPDGVGKDAGEICE